MSKSSKCYIVIGLDDSPNRSELHPIAVFLNKKSADKFVSKDSDRFIEEVQLVTD